MKRSNRLVLLIGVFLAVVAFVLVVVTLGNPPSAPPVTVAPTTGKVVMAKVDIPLSTRIRLDQLDVKELPLTAISPGAFEDTSQVVGQVARQPVTAGAQITQTTLTGGVAGAILDVNTPAGLRAIAVRVDQTSGVGTIIKAGDYVDGIMGLTEEQFAAVLKSADPDEAIVVNPGPNGTTTKLILQGMQVLGTLLPPAAPATTTNAAASGSPEPSVQPGTVLNDQQEIVILAVSAQQAEIIRWTQLQLGRPGLTNPLLSTLSLVLRSPDDFVDPVTGAPVPPVASKTTGITLRELIDTYGVLPPVVESEVLPNNRLPAPVRPVKP